MAVSPILSIPEVAPTQTDKTTTMNSAIEAIEAATQDQLAVSFSGGNVTLTALQYTRHQVFICSGLSADRNLVVPLTKRVFVVRNTSVHVVTVKGASGATVAVSAGTGSIIQCDGTDCVSLAAGGAGVAGPTGLPGGAITIGYTFSTTTTNSDPGSGVLRLNAGTQNTATAIYLDLLDANAVDWTTVLDALDDSTSTTKGYLRLFNRSDDANFLMFTLSAVVSHTGYRELTVAVVASSASSPFSAADSLALAFTPSGDKGTTGATGATGAAGTLNLAQVNAWTASQVITPVTLTDAATITVDFAGSNNFEVTLGGNRTLANPTNQVKGQAGQVVVIQDGTGSRTLTMAANWHMVGGGSPAWSTAAGSIDIISYYTQTSGHISYSVLNNC